MATENSIELSPYEIAQEVRGKPSHFELLNVAQYANHSEDDRSPFIHCKKERKADDVTTESSQRANTRYTDIVRRCLHVHIQLCVQKGPLCKCVDV